jgi:hypothetical protein
VEGDVVGLLIVYGYLPASTVTYLLPVVAIVLGVSVTTFFTASRAHLRRARPDGLGREQRGRTRAVEREERPG